MFLKNTCKIRFTVTTELRFARKNQQSSRYFSPILLQLPNITIQIEWKQ